MQTPPVPRGTCLRSALFAIIANPACAAATLISVSGISFFAPSRSLVHEASQLRRHGAVSTAPSRIPQGEDDPRPPRSGISRFKTNSAGRGRSSPPHEAASAASNIIPQRETDAEDRVPPRQGRVPQQEAGRGFRSKRRTRRTASLPSKEEFRSKKQNSAFRDENEIPIL